MINIMNIMKTNYLLDKQFQNLFHISDIHIRNGEERFQEFVDVFNTLALTIKNHKKYNKDTSLIIITGDILDKGLHMTAHAIQLLKILVDCLTNLANTIIIPGNHDDKKDVGFSKLDSLSAIFSHYSNEKLHYNNDNLHYSNEKLHYIRESGIYNFGTNLVFGHTSVIDKKLIKADMIDTTDRVKIALFHGMVDDKTKDGDGQFLLRDCDFSVNDFKGYNKVLLGDVHKVQKLGNGNIWYAGSLVQKAFNEDRRQHGGLLVWDINSDVDPEYIHINNKHGYITLKVTKGKITGEATAPTGSLHLKEYIDFIQETLTERSSIRLRCDSDTTREDLPNIFSQLGKYTKVVGESVVWENKQQELDTQQTTETLDKLLEEYLKTYYPDNIEDLTSLDKEYKLKYGHDSVEVKLTGRWSPYLLEWENLYNYGAKYSLDFNKLPNDIISICGANGSGKSKIVETLLLAIYGDKVKGAGVTHMISYGKKSAMTKIVIENNGDLYTIIRTFEKKKSKTETSVKILKNDENITATDKKQTENFIKNIFGELVDLCDTHISKQGSHQNFIQKTSKDKLGLLKRIFGTDIYEKIGTEVSISISKEKEKVKQLDNRLREIKLQDINKLETDIQIAKNNINEAEVNQKQLGNDQRQYDKLITERKCLEDNISKLSEYLTHLRLQLIQTKYDNNTLDIMLESNKTLINGITNKLEGKENEIESLCRKITDIDLDVSDKLTKLQTELDTTNENIEITKTRISKHTTELEGLVNKTTDIRTKIVNGQRQVEQLTISEEDWSCNDVVTYNKLLSNIGNISVLEKSNKQLLEKLEKCKLTTADDFTQLETEYQLYNSKQQLQSSRQSEIDIIKSQMVLLKQQLDSDNYKYDNNCSCCQHNREVDNIPQTLLRIEELETKSENLGHELFSLNSFLTLHASLPEKYKTYLEFNKFKAQQLKLHQDISQYYDLQMERDRYIKTHTDLQRQTQLIKTDFKLKNQLDGFKEQCQKMDTSINKNQSSLVELGQDKYKLELSLNEAKNHLDQLAINNQYDKDINLLKSKIDEDKNTIQNLDSENKSLQSMRLVNIENDRLTLMLTTNKQEMTLLTDKCQLLNESLNELDGVSESLSRLTKGLECFQHDLYKMVGELEKAADNHKSYRELKDELDICEFNLNLTKKYQILTREFPNYGNKKYIKQLNNCINGYLWNMTKFTIDIEQDKMDEIDFLKRDKDTLIPIEACSGFEKFAIAIAIRLALAKINPLNTLDGLIIDEGFGVFDSQNLKRLPDILEPLKGLFRQIFIITHIDGLQSELPNKIHITTANGLPLINY